MPSQRSSIRWRWILHPSHCHRTASSFGQQQMDESHFLPDCWRREPQGSLILILDSKMESRIPCAAHTRIVLTHAAPSHAVLDALCAIKNFESFLSRTSIKIPSVVVLDSSNSGPHPPACCPFRGVPFLASKNTPPEGGEPHSGGAHCVFWAIYSSFCHPR